MIQTAALPMSEEEYIQYELKSERRSEYINGQLFEMPGEKDNNNQIAFLLAMLLYKQLPTDFQVYNHDIKVAIPGRKKYYYPDVFATTEQQTERNAYIKTTPALIIEVVSENSRKTDYVDKYIDYITIPSLEYYLIVEPDNLLVTVCERVADNWIVHKYTRFEDIIRLPKLNITFPLGEVYANIKK